MKQMKQMKELQFFKDFMKKNKAVIIAVAAVFLVGTLLGMVAEAKTISQKFVRFHIVANSNSVADQNVKMKVREAIFSELDFSQITSKEEALEFFKEHQYEISDLSNRVLRENGFSYQAKVTVSKKEFPVRQYSDFVLPAGNYDAVSIILGEGAGENFFCVMYPSLCKIEGVTEKTDSNAEILNCVLTEQEISAITGNEKQIVCKFKIVEWFEKLFCF